MICPNCGKEIPDESLFCGECGADLNQINQQPIQEPVSEPVAEQQTQTVKNEPNGSNTMSLLSLIFGIFGVICIFFNSIIATGLGIAAIILGLMGRKIGARSMGTAGMVLGIIIVAIIALILIFTILAMVFGISMLALSA